MDEQAAISLLQITDMHILSTPQATLLGINTAHYFQAVLEMAFAEKPHFDLILLTGDLAQDPCIASYRLILNRLEAYHIPCICLPGNHDNYVLMQQILNTELINCRKQVFLGNWQIISLNSQIIGSEKGHVSNKELLFLEECLSSHPNHNALIAVHHHCMATKSEWMDTMMIDNSAELLAITDKYRQIKVITNGHIHQVMDIQTESVRILGTPSTCFQFKPESKAFNLDNTTPGYRTIKLYKDGRVESQAIRLSEQLKGLQKNISGY